MADFFPADVGRIIVASGGLGTITGYTDASTVTVEITQAFPTTGFNSGDWQVLGSPNTSCTPSAKDPVGEGITLTLGASGWRPEDAGKYVRINGGLCKITSITSSTVAAARIEAELTAAVAAPALAWTLEGSAWGGAFEWPRCGTLFEQRLWLAGSPGFPQTVWGSVIGDYLDFTTGTLDDEGMAYVIASGELNPIMHLASARGLVAFTSGGEFSIQGGQDRAITPTNIRVRDQSNYGTAQVPPVRVGQEIYFVQRAGRKLRSMSQNQYDDGQYVSPDMSVLAEHVTAGGIASLAYQAEPDATLYLVRGDGQMATLAADRDQEVFAWSRQLTQGAFEDVEVVPTPDGNRVFVVVARTIDGVTTRNIEMLAPGLNTDAAITGASEGGAATWGGLGHLKGRRVMAKGDGVFLGEFIVSPAGQITLPRTARTVEIGLGYETTVKTLTPEFMAQGGSSSGHQLSIHEVKARLLRTVGCKINLQTVAFRQMGLAVLDKPPAPFTGDKVAGNLQWADGVAQTLIQQTLPYDFHLLAVIVRMTANEA